MGAPFSEAKWEQRSTLATPVIGAHGAAGLVGPSDTAVGEVEGF